MVLLRENAYLFPPFRYLTWPLCAKSSFFISGFAFNGVVSRVTLVFGSSDAYNSRFAWQSLLP